MCFFEQIAGQAVKEAFTRLGYRKQTNSHKEAIHHLIGTKTSSFAYLLVQGSCFAIPHSLSSWLNHLQCCLLVFSRVSLSLQFTVHKTVVGSQVIYEYHVFSRWKSGSTGPRKSTYDARPSLGACIEDVVWGRDYTLLSSYHLKTQPGTGWIQPLES